MSSIRLRVPVGTEMMATPEITRGYLDKEVILGEYKFAIFGIWNIMIKTILVW